MINVEEIIGEVLKPLRTADIIGLYHFGNEYELKEVFDIKKYNVKQPYVWLVMPLEGNSTNDIDKKELRTKVKLILACNTHKEWLNPKRNIETYEKILNPLYDNIVKTFTKSIYITVIDDNINVKKLHNYYKTDLGTRSNPQKNTVNAYWDVIVMDFEAIFKPIICKP